MSPEDWKATASAAMQRYARGDDTAFGPLYEEVAPRLYTFLCRRTANSARAEDILQQTLLQMHASRRHFVQGSQVMPWTFAIARRLLIDAFRKDAREKLAVDDAFENELISPAPSPFALACSRELLGRIALGLHHVSERNRVAFELVKLEGFGISEVAEMLETTELSVRLRVHRTLHALRGRLGTEMDPRARERSGARLRGMRGQ